MFVLYNKWFPMKRFWNKKPGVLKGRKKSIRFVCVHCRKGKTWRPSFGFSASKCRVTMIPVLRKRLGESCPGSVWLLMRKRRRSKTDIPRIPLHSGTTWSENWPGTLNFKLASSSCEIFGWTKLERFVLQVVQVGLLLMDERTELLHVWDKNAQCNNQNGPYAWGNVLRSQPRWSILLSEVWHVDPIPPIQQCRQVDGYPSWSLWRMGQLFHFLLPHPRLKGRKFDFLEVKFSTWVT